MATTTTDQAGSTNRLPQQRHATLTLAVAVLGFFVVTFDAVVVNVALPTIRQDLGGGIGGLQWVVDGYTLPFAALLLTAGAFSDRLGARQAFAGGLIAFVIASAACGFAPSLPFLIAARIVQGAAAAVMMPSSMALIGQAYPDTNRRTHAVAIWAMGGAVASSAGPILGGVLTLVNWRSIFFINVPVGILALLLLVKSPRSIPGPSSVDWPGQITAVLAMGGLIFGVIQAGAWSITAWPVLLSFLIAVLGAFGFVSVERRSMQPMLPSALMRLPVVRTSSIIGFAFMVGYYGLPFITSLYLQQLRGLSALATGVLFLPMFLIGFILTPFSARIAQRVGKAVMVTTGLMIMSAGLLVMALVVSASTPYWIVSTLMIPIGLGGPLVMPMTTALLLQHVPAARAGTASGIFNTSRQVGGALAVAVFGALLAQHDSFVHGQRLALCIAAVVALIAAVASRGLHTQAVSGEQQLMQKGVVNV